MSKIFINILMSYNTFIGIDFFFYLFKNNFSNELISAYFIIKSFGE